MAEIKNNTAVLKADADLREKLISFYEDSFCEKIPPYALFQAKCEDCTVTLYTSGKVTFQGKRAAEEAAVWESQGLVDAAATSGEKMQAGPSLPSLSDGKNAKDPKNDFIDTTAIGSDEVGTGDFFGPVVVTASYVREEDFPFLKELGVRDSKKLTDDKIKKIAPQIMERIPHATHVCDNEEYNGLQGKGINMNQLKALFHNECLFRMKEKSGCDLAVVDQFEPPSAYYRHIQGQDKQVKDIVFMTKAEDRCMAVAVSSVISRYLFLEEMEKMAGMLEVDQVPLGAGPAVDSFGAELLKDKGDFIFERVAKLNFANLEKIKALV